MTDIIIIGAGPAGLTAAIYARRAAKSVLVLEAKGYGGQIINTPHIENYPVAAHISGFDFATKVYEQAKALGAVGFTCNHWLKAFDWAKEIGGITLVK